MVTQEQAVVSSSIVSVFSVYILWSLIQTQSFVPYTVYPTPNVSNILLFIFLVSLIFSGVLELLYLAYLGVYFLITKKRKEMQGTTVWLMFMSAVGVSTITLVLHVFSVVRLQVSLLSYALIWGIVAYGKFKEKKRREKYLAAGNRGREAKSPVKV